MNSPRRPRHSKRFSAVRLSSDSAASTLPAYTSPPWKAPNLPEEGSDRPPDYPDSAEDADADTETDGGESSAPCFSSPPLSAASSRARRSPARRSVRRQSSAPSSDSYLDSLLERSVHALEMSNALLQSSMSTQSSLASVLADDSAADRTLEARAHMLSSRINDNRDLHDTWMEDLDHISKGVDGLVRRSSTNRNEDDQREDGPPLQSSISKSLPTSGFAERIRRRHQPSRRASVTFSDVPGSHLNYTNHDRSHFVAPAPRALTMYIDSSEHPDLITLPATLGIRPTSQLPPTPVISETFTARSPPPPPEPVQQNSRAVDILSVYGGRRGSFHRSTSSLGSFKTSRSTRSGGSDSTGSSVTMRKSRQSKSPPPPLDLEKHSPSCSPSTYRSRSATPHRTGSPTRHTRPMTPPIEELSASSSSSSSDAFHVEQSVQSLRQILYKQRTASSASSPNINKSIPLPSPRPPPRLLNPPISPPLASTSNATASVSRLFTKPRHTTATRPPSPPRHSSLKNRSAPPTPVAPSPSPVPSLLSIPDALGVIARRRSATSSSGASTPKRISFAELPESYSSSKPDGASSRFKARSRSKSRDRKAGSGSGSGKKKDKDGAESEEGLGWWAKWFLAPATDTVGLRGERYDERIARGSSWGTRPGLGNGIEDWGA